jgi:hypothetical protein
MYIIKLFMYLFAGCLAKLSISRSQWRRMYEWLQTGFGLVIGFIEHKNMADTNNYCSRYSGSSAWHVFTSRCLVTEANTVLCFGAQSYIMTECLSVSLSLLQAPIWVHGQIVINVRHLCVCCGKVSLARGRVCSSQLLSGLVSDIPWSLRLCPLKHRS